jgi:hypothetical protein
LESFSQTGLSTSTALANRTLPQSVGSLFLKADNSLSRLAPLATRTVGNHVYGLFYRDGSATGCALTHRSLQLKLFELGSPFAMAEGLRLPRGGTVGTNSTRTVYSDLRGGIVTTTELSAGVVRVKAYDVRDGRNPKFMSESASLTGIIGNPFGSPSHISGLSARESNVVYTVLATGGASPTRSIAALDVAFPDVAIRTINAGSAMTVSSTTSPENVTNMVARNGVLFMSLADFINDPKNRNYFASTAVDTPSALASWTRVADATATSGMAAASLVVDGTVAYVAATDRISGAFNGNLCVVNIATPTAPAHTRCVDAQTPANVNVRRQFSLGAIPGFLVAGNDEALHLFDIRSGPPTTTVSAVREIDPPGGVSQNMTTAGSFIYTTLGNSSQLPLGLLLGIEASPDTTGVPPFVTVGSLNDADPDVPSQPFVSGDAFVIPMGEADFSAFIVQLY